MDVDVINLQCAFLSLVVVLHIVLQNQTIDHLMFIHLYSSLMSLIFVHAPNNTCLILFTAQLTFGFENVNQYDKLQFCLEKKALFGSKSLD